MNEAARQAIKDKISFLEDNMYRHEHFTNTPDWEEIERHKKQIAELKEELKP